MLRLLSAILILCSNDIYGQLQKRPKRIFSASNKFCVERLAFYKNNTYLYTYGCERRGKINVGKYNLKSKKLFPVDPKMLKIILHFNILPSKPDNAKLIIKVKDNFDRPIKSAKILAVTYDQDSVYEESLKKNFNLILSYDEFVANEEGQIEISNEKLDIYKYFELSGERSITGKANKFYSRDLRNQILLIITSPTLGYYSSLESIEWTSLPKTEFQMKDGVLVFNNRRMLQN